MTENIPIKLNEKPAISVRQVEKFLNQNWEFTGNMNVQELVSYDSRTYVVTSTDSEHERKRYIFKIANSIESRDVRFFDCLSLILQHLQNNGILAQNLIKSKDGKVILDFEEKPMDNDGQGKTNILKSLLLTYIDGDLILNRIIDKDLCWRISKELYKLTNCVDQICSDLGYLEEFSSNSIWNVKNASLIRHIIPHFECEHKQTILKLTLSNYEEQILPNMGKLTRGFIHGDPNDMNILLTDRQRVGFIDWQDCTISVKVYDLSILIFSLMSIGIDSPESLDAYSIGKYCLQGYLYENPEYLNETDIKILPICVQTRIALSLCIGYYTNKYLDPTNIYLLNTQKTGWRLLEDLINNHKTFSEQWKP